MKDDGPMCVFKKCMQNGCNLVIPDSFYLKVLENKSVEVITQAQPAKKGVKKINYKKEMINFY